MPKRLHDTGLWSKQWFRVLSPAEKCAFQYLIDHCDGAGVWDADTAVADFVIGEGVDWPALPTKVKDNIQVLPSGKWWLIDFVDFQCGGQVSETTTNRAHLSYLRQLKKHGLYEAYMAHSCAMNGAIEIDNDNELDKDKTKKEPAVKRLVDTYHDAYLARTREKPTVTGRWGRAFKTWLRGHSEDDIRLVIAYFFAYDKRTQFGFDKFQTAFDNLAPAALGHKPRAGPAKGWKCPHCGFEGNTHTGSRCLRCKQDRDEPAQRAAGGQ